jgi:hypothetical protein
MRKEDTIVELKHKIEVLVSQCEIKQFEDEFQRREHKMTLQQKHASLGVKTDFLRDDINQLLASARECIQAATLRIKKCCQMKTLDQTNELQY